MPFMERPRGDRVRAGGQPGEEEDDLNEYPLPNVSFDLTGQIALVTGATSRPWLALHRGSGCGGRHGAAASRPTSRAPRGAGPD